MIRPFQTKDLPDIMTLWLSSNLEAHAFISSNYWRKAETEVAGAISQAEVYVYTDDYDRILGFIGLVDNYIAGLFVQKTARSQGIGKALMDHTKSRKLYLTVAVYAKNHRAVDFYCHQDFLKYTKQLDPQTQEEEWIMTWDAGS